MPKGIPNKKKEEPIKEAPKPDFSIDVKPVEAAQIVAAIAPKFVWPPLAPGQKYFVDPMTDEHLIGDAEKDSVLYRPKDGRKPFYINAKR